MAASIQFKEVYPVTVNLMPKITVAFFRPSVWPLQTFFCRVVLSFLGSTI